MQRRKAEGRGVLQVTPTAETLSYLRELAALTGGTMKGEAEMILRRGVRTALAEAKKLRERFAPLYHEAIPYRPYRAYLAQTPEGFRVGDHEVDSTKWQAIASQLAAYFQITTSKAGLGWTQERAEAFLAGAAKPH